MMTLYEMTRLLVEPFLPALQGKARGDLRTLLRQTPSKPAALLDVGARKSPYTIGLSSKITLLDIPRENETQKHLNLGFTDNILNDVRQQRSNVSGIILEDMTSCTQPSKSFDGVICVEVIEHIQNDDAFVSQIERVLRPGGWVYITTPNGDYIHNRPPHYNPNHVRHYTRTELFSLLDRHFQNVVIDYGIKTGKYRYRGLRSMSLHHPMLLLQSMLCNVINRFESRGLEQQSHRTAHLFAVAWKALE